MPKSKQPSARAVFVSPSDCTERIGAYFDACLTDNREVPDVEGLAVFLSTTREALIALKQDPIYGDEVGKAFNRIAAVKKQLAFGGKIPATVFTFDMRNNHGYTDKADAPKEPITVNFEGRTAEWAQ